jgi:hypothetical protein
MEFARVNLRILDASVKVAFLLTGDPARAADVVVRAIHDVSYEDLFSTDAGLLRAVVAMAIADNRADTDRPDLPASGLPKELERILHLAKQLRQCFVLRTLVGLPALDCAQLLKLPANVVDERAGVAAQELSIYGDRPGSELRKSQQESTRRKSMLYVTTLDITGLTPQEYRAVLDEMGVEIHPDAHIFMHLTTPIEGGYRVVEVWDNEEAFNAFLANRLTPANKALGLDRQAKVTVTPLHNFFAPRLEELPQHIAELPGGLRPVRKEERTVA